MDMRYYWIRDRVRQNQFKVTWKPGKVNRADPWSKHHSPTVSRQIRHKYMVKQPYALEYEGDAYYSADEDDDERCDTTRVQPYVIYHAQQPMTLHSTSSSEGVLGFPSPAGLDSIQSPSPVLDTLHAGAYMFDGTEGSPPPRAYVPGATATNG